MKTITFSDEQYETLVNALSIACNSIPMSARGDLEKERDACVALLSHVDAPKKRARKVAAKRHKSLNRVAAQHVPVLRGEVVTPDPAGRCGQCGAAGFTYGEYAANGTRGYRCMTCESIKSEAWCEAYHKKHPYQHRVSL